MALVNTNPQKLLAAVILFLFWWLTASALASAKSLQDSQIVISTDLEEVSDSDIERVRREAEKGLKAIPPVLGFEYSQKIEIKIVDDGICRTTPDTHIIILPIWHIRNNRAVIIHEVSHAIVRRHENNSFFSEGLAEFFQAKFGEDIAGAAYYEEPLHLSLDDLVIKYRDRLLPLSYLRTNNEVYVPIGQEKRKLAYFEAGSFIKFLYEVHGGHKLQELYATETLSYDTVYGKSFQDLEAEWLRYVLREKEPEASRE